MASNLQQRALRVPYLHSTAQVDQLGIVALRCRVFLYLKTRTGLVSDPVRFAVDSGASFTLIDLELAQSRGLPIPPPEAEVVLSLRTATGLQPFRVRPGRIRCWWNADCAGYPFDWPVLFRVGGPLGTPSILGLGGVISTCSWHFGGTYSPDAPYGALTLTDER